MYQTLKKITKKVIPRNIYNRISGPRYYLMYHRALSKKKYFVSASEFGLANRLKSIISAMRFADEYRKKALIYWPVNDECGCRISDLFENKIEEIDEQTFARISKNKDYHIVSHSRLDTLPKDKISYGFGESWHPEFPFYHIDCEYDRIPLAAKLNILPYLHSLVPKKTIIELTDKFSGSVDTKTLGVQLRTWNDAISHRYDKRDHLFDFDRICQIIDKCQPEKIFVSSDSEKELMEIRERYRGRVTYAPKRTFFGDRGSRMGAEDAFVDMRLLSKCGTLIACYLSTYPEMAWWLGDCKARVWVV